MNIVKITGGMGNQMFQYAFAKAMEYRGEEVLLDLSAFEQQHTKDTVRPYELTHFDVNLKTATPKQIKAYTGFFWELISKAGEHLPFFQSKMVIERTHAYHENVLHYHNRYFAGYWQSERYFSEVEEVIRKDFTFQMDGLKESDQCLLQKIRSNEETVSIHVRGGDYRTNGNEQLYGGICTKEYYRHAIAYIKTKLSNPTFYVFTNDEEFSREILSDCLEAVVYVEGHGEEDAYLDMFLMSQCRHQIIANSSFSWWGAWLNGNQKKCVIAPKRWQNGTDVRDIIPDSWIRL